MRDSILWLEKFLTYNFDQLFRVSARKVTGGRNAANAQGGVTIWPMNRDLIAGFHSVSGFRRSSVEQDKARVAKLLSYSAARAKTAQFQEDIEAHAKTSSQRRYERYGFGKIPKSFPFFFSGGFLSSPVFSTIKSCLIFNNGSTESL